MRLILPVPPSVNHMYIGSKRVMDKVAREWCSTAGWRIKMWTREAKWAKTIDTWLYADMWFFMPDKRKRDSHNTLKILLDVIEGFVYENDFYVMPRIQQVGYDKENPRVEIEFSEA